MAETHGFTQSRANKRFLDCEMTLYHVTPRDNRDSISEFGIDPARSKGKARQCWFVDDSKLLWAVAHCSARHSVSVDLLDVWSINRQIPRLRRTAWQGVFCTFCLALPDGCDPAVVFVERAK